MHRPAISPLSVAAILAAVVTGCAHHKANQYAYAPPLAPPVYPQPQTPAQPAVASPSPGPMVAAPTIAPAPVIVGGPVAVAGGEILASPDGSCPPCVGAGGIAPVAYEGAVQTQPCPPGN